MSELFKYAWRLQIGTLLIDGAGEDQPLDIEFSVDKSVSREPNTVSISVYNLNRTHRDQLRSSSRVGVRLEAGYRSTGELTTIFDGDLRDVENIRDGRNVKTVIEGEDGGNAYREGRVQLAFNPGTSVVDVLRRTVGAMGIGEGNLREVTDLEVNGSSTYPRGTAVSGSARGAVDRLVRSCGCTWSIQDGNFQLRRRGEPLRSTAIVLSPETGLLESPTRSKPERGRPRLVNAKCLMLPGLYPGRVVLLRSSELEAQLSIRKVRFGGSTFGNLWGAELELEEF